jgi:hypothetical protein
MGDNMKRLLAKRILGLRFETFAQCFVGTTMFVYFVILPVTIDMKSQRSSKSFGHEDMKAAVTPTAFRTHNDHLLDTMEKRIAFRKYLLSLGNDDNNDSK